MVEVDLVEMKINTGEKVAAVGPVMATISDKFEYTEPSDEAEFLSFSFPEQTGAADIGDGTIDVEVEFGTDVSDLVAIFTTSEGVRHVKILAVVQESGETSNDYTNPVTMVVTAQDGVTTKDWVVTVTVAAEPEGGE